MSGFNWKNTKWLLCTIHHSDYFLQFENQTCPVFGSPLYLQWVKTCLIDTWVILVGHLLGQQVSEFTVHNFVLKEKFKVVLNHRLQWGSNICVSRF